MSNLQKFFSVSFVVLSTMVLQSCPSGSPPSGVGSDTDVSVSDAGDVSNQDGINEDSIVHGCLSNEDCPVGVCNINSFTCVECVNHADCPSGQRCSKWECVAAVQCSDEKPCPEGQVCEEVSGYCVECLVDDDCGEDAKCIAMTCHPSCEMGCPPNWVCSEDVGVCVECFEDKQCAETYWCNTEEYICYEDQCTPLSLTCVGNDVAECAPNGSGWTNLAPCPSDTTCVNGECKEGLVCVPNVRTCKDENTAIWCNSDGSALSEVECAMPQRCFNGECTHECIPDCDGKACGASGCPGYFCGECPEGFKCGDDFQCHGGTCEPGRVVCLNGGVAVCTPNGVWGETQACPPNSQCLDGQCVPIGPACQPMSRICDGNAWAQCLEDGSGWSEPVPCPSGSVCQEGACELLPPVCEPGATVCAGTAGFVTCKENGQGWTQIQYCQEGETCLDGKCVFNQVCTPGQRICQGNNVSVCNPSGTQWLFAESCPSNGSCVNGYCQVNPDKQCPEILECMVGLGCQEPDFWGCGAPCLDGASDEGAVLAQELFYCVWDVCGSWSPSSMCMKTAMQGPCYEITLKCTNSCIPNCSSKQCGPDGCGGSCGVCSPDSWCDQYGKCVGSCVPKCANKDCGPDGCGGTCGSCPASSTCNASGICVQSCVPNCGGKVCGSDGCGGVCGLCGADEACKNGTCVPSLTCKSLMECFWACAENDQVCTSTCWQQASPAARDQWTEWAYCVQDQCGENPSWPCYQQAISGACKESYNACQNCTPACVGKQCGTDGCGGTCGNCPAGFSCDQFGYCLCQPQCTNKQCGNDMCGGSCGTCPSNSVCNYLGKCVCLPQCDGKECGDDGCGGTCGTCPSGATCNSGLCTQPPPPTCGNGFCQKGKGETCENCPKDCGPCEPYCGDYICTDWEDCTNCPMDCGYCPTYCGDYYCDYDMGESCEWCPEDCGPCDSYCGDYYCDYNMGESCDWCPQDCGPCESYCGDYYCDYNMGESCDWCPEDCGSCEGYCGDYYCDYYSGETCEWCPQDCGQCEGYCGDQYCDPNLGENCEWCAEDCGECSGDCCYAHDGTGCSDPYIVECVCSADPYCCQQMWDDICVNTAKNNCGLDCDECTPSCFSADGTFKECGDDGCGGVCGYCPPGRTCNNGKCLNSCVPSCFINGMPKQCGSDGCGGSCGVCPDGMTCDENMGICFPGCIPNCSGKTCGPNGCGGTCGTCPPGTPCVNGQCSGSSGMSCAELIECSYGCNFSASCVFQCFNQGSAAAKSAFQTLVTCVAGQCGYNVTSQCAEGAFKNACAQQYQQCIIN